MAVLTADRTGTPGTKPLHDLVSSIERARQGPSPARNRTR